jgi:hypothetical protein
MDPLGGDRKHGAAGEKVSEVPEADDLASVVPQLRTSWLVIGGG